MIPKKNDIKFGRYKIEKGKLTELINPLMISRYWGDKGLERDKVAISYTEVPGDLFEKIHKEKSYKIKDDKFLKKKTFENVVDLNFEEGNTLVLVLTLAFNAYSDTKVPFESPVILDIEDSIFIQTKFKDLKKATMLSSEYKGLNPTKYPNISPPFLAIENDDCSSSDPCSRVTFDIQIPICVYYNGALIQLVREIILPEITYELMQEDEIISTCATRNGDSSQNACRKSDCPDCSHPKNCDTDEIIEIKYANFICFFKLFNST